MFHNVLDKTQSAWYSTRMNTDKQLDKYDNLMIRLFKNSNLRHSQRFFQYMKRIWGWRCGMEPEFVKVEYIVYHFIELGFAIGIINESLIKRLISDADPLNMYRFVARQQKPGDFKDYYVCWMMALASYFALTKVSDLPGFKKPARFKKQA